MPNTHLFRMCFYNGLIIPPVRNSLKSFNGQGDKYEYQTTETFTSARDNKV